MRQQTNSNVSPAAALYIFQHCNQQLPTWSNVTTCHRIPSWSPAFNKLNIMSSLWARPDEHISISASGLHPLANIYLTTWLHYSDLASCRTKWTVALDIEHYKDIASCHNKKTVMSALLLPLIYFKFVSSCSWQWAMLLFASKIKNLSAALKKVTIMCMSRGTS